MILHVAHGAVHASLEERDRREPLGKPFIFRSRRLAVDAAEAGVSLNRLASAKLAQ